MSDKRKNKDRGNVVFRRIGGRIVPITLAAGVGVGALEASRRTTLLDRGKLKIVERRSIFTPSTTVKAKFDFGGLTSKTIGFAKFTKKKKARGFVKMVVSVDPRISAPLFAGVSKSAKRQGIKTMYGEMASPKMIAIMKARRGKFVSLSKSGRRIVGARAAKGEVTRLIKGAARSVIKGVIRLK